MDPGLGMLLLPQLPLSRQGRQSCTSCFVLRSIPGLHSPWPVHQFICSSRCARAWQGSPRREANVGADVPGAPWKGRGAGSTTRLTRGRAEGFGVVSVPTAAPHRAISIIDQHFRAASCLQRSKEAVLMAFNSSCISLTELHILWSICEVSVS